MKDIKKMPTNELINILCEAEDQFIINRVAYELTCRIYVPNKTNETFENMLYRFGYKNEENIVGEIKRKN